MTAAIRLYRPDDEAAAYHVCLKTGDHGADGEPFYREDPDALGRIYVGPYLKFSPDLSLMLEDEKGVCGYALAALDSKEFFNRYETEWRSKLVREFPRPKGPEESWSRVESVYETYHDPDYFCPEPYDEYPSHLHIDLLSRVQGKGHGRTMMTQLLELLTAQNSPGVHLGMSASNDRAYGFYRKLGFHELTRDSDSIYLGMKLVT